MSCLKCKRLIYKEQLCSTHYHESKNIICVACERPVYIPKFQLCETHYKYYIHVLPIKIKVFDILGWNCKCCGSTEIHSLLADHIDPKNKIKSDLNTVSFYNRILKSPNPKVEYQTLCWPCNNSKKATNRCRLNHNIKNREQLIEHLE